MLTPDALRDMRRDMVAQVNDLFAALMEVAETDQMERLVRLAERFERERDTAREQITKLERELKMALARANDSPAFVNAATIKDAAVTLVSTMRGLANAPLSDPKVARVTGQINKAVVAFDEATAGILS